MLETLKGLGFHSEDILLHMVNAVILFAIVRWLIYKPVRKFMAARTQRIASSLEEAAEAHAQAESLKAEYEKRFAQAEDAARTRALEITAAANESAKAMTEAAKRESLLLLDKARERSKEEHNRALSGLQDELVDLSISIAEQILRREVNRDDSAQLVESYLTTQTAMRNVQSAIANVQAGAQEASAKPPVPLDLESGAGV
ncbi:MAG: ATP synthase F0 subunit B [Oscillospiraceae bacterium]|jgi:F-type H+-transporting ATPase subunit b|nr:ATP synthase F0 subunit B [Oscillospiraceae bacterium]